MELPAPRGELSHLLRCTLEEVGFDWRAASAEPYAPVEWARPPLFTDMELRGSPLQPHLAVPVSRELEEIVDTYERFIAGYIRSSLFRSKGSDGWLAKELKMRRDSASMLFVPPGFNRQRLDLHLNLVQMAVLVQYNFETVLEQGPGTYKVTTVPDGYVFGVEDRALCSNLRRKVKTIKVAGLNTDRLLRLARGEPVTPARPSLFDTIAKWAQARQVYFGDDYEPLRLALQTLWWRSAGVSPPTLEALKQLTSSKEALRMAVKEAARWRDHEEPLTALRLMLVPEFLNRRRFSELFGNPEQWSGRQITPELANRWDNALMEIDPGEDDLTI